jgi:DNA repair protein RecO (recombination protein O)
MLVQTHALVLRYFPYGDSGMIVHFLTRELGYRSAIVQGLKSKTPAFKRSYFLPLFEVDMVLYEKSGDQLRRIKEAKPGHLFQKLQSDQSSLAMLYFLAEVLEKTTREDDIQMELYDFIIDFLNLCDQSEIRIANLHLYFLFQLSKYLGFAPEKSRLNPPFYWDMREGVFRETTPPHPDYSDPENSLLINELLSLPLDEVQRIQLTGSKRTELIKEVMNYFYIHRTGMKQIKTLDVLEALFH